MTPPATIEFFFDPACPWTWMTSRWLVDAAGRTGADVQWRNLSLAVVNADRELPERYRRPMEAARGAHRIIAAVRADGRNDVIGAYYTEWGRRFHHDRVDVEPDQLPVEVAAAAGAEQWASAATDEKWDAAIEASTKEGQELAGGSDVGSPVLTFGDPGAGSSVRSCRRLRPATKRVALLEHVVAAASMPSFYELKRGRQGKPQLGPRP